MPRKQQSVATGNDMRARITVEVDSRTREILDEMCEYLVKQKKPVSLSSVTRLALRFLHSKDPDVWLNLWEINVR